MRANTSITIKGHRGFRDGPHLPLYLDGDPDTAEDR